MHVCKCVTYGEPVRSVHYPFSRSQAHKQDSSNAVQSLSHYSS